MTKDSSTSNCGKEEAAITAVKINQAAMLALSPGANIDGVISALKDIAVMSEEVADYIIGDDAVLCVKAWSAPSAS